MIIDHDTRVAAWANEMTHHITHETEWVSYHRIAAENAYASLAAARDAAARFTVDVYADIAPDDHATPVIQFPGTNIIRIGTDPAPWTTP